MCGHSVCKKCFKSILFRSLTVVVRVCVTQNENFAIRLPVIEVEYYGIKIQTLETVLQYFNSTVVRDNT